MASIGGAVYENLIQKSELLAATVKAYMLMEGETAVTEEIFVARGMNALSLAIESPALRASHEFLMQNEDFSDDFFSMQYLEAQKAMN